MKLPDIIAIGKSGNLIEIFETLSANHRLVAILDDSPSLDGSALFGIPIHPIDAVEQFPGAQFICLIGSPASFRKRPEIVARTGLAREDFTNVMHPTASVSKMATIGLGVVGFDGVLITSDARVGDHVLLMPRCIIHHGVSIGDYTLIGAGVIVAGGVNIGTNCYVGSGSVLRDGIRVGDGALIGIGSVVTRDVAPGSVVAGNPARPLGGAGHAGA